MWRIQGDKKKNGSDSSGQEGEDCGLNGGRSCSSMEKWLDHGYVLKMAPIGLAYRLDESYERKREVIDNSKSLFLEQLEVWRCHSLTEAGKRLQLV